MTDGMKLWRRKAGRAAGRRLGSALFSAMAVAAAALGSSLSSPPASADGPGSGLVLDPPVVVVRGGPVRAEGVLPDACAGEEVEVSWLVPAGAEDSRSSWVRLPGDRVRVGAGGRVSAELPPLSAFPGAWRVYVVVAGACLGQLVVAASAPVLLPLDAPEAKELSLPEGVRAQQVGAVVLGRGAAPLRGGEGEEAGGQRARDVTLVVAGARCDERYEAPNGDLVFLLGTASQPPACGEEGRPVFLEYRAGAETVRVETELVVRRGVVQPFPWFVPPHGEAAPTGTPPAGSGAAPEVLPDARLSPPVATVGGGPVRAEGRLPAACVGSAPALGWFAQVVGEDGSVTWRELGRAPVWGDGHGDFAAELPPLVEFPGTWVVFVGVVGDCVQAPTYPGLADVHIVGSAPVVVPLAALARELGLPDGVEAAGPSVLVLPPAANWLRVYRELGETYGSPGEKAVVVLTPIVDGFRCREAFVAPNGTAVFLLGTKSQPPACGEEGRPIAFAVAEGGEAAVLASELVVRRGFVQQVRLDFPPLQSGPGSVERSSDETAPAEANGTGAQLPSAETETPERGEEGGTFPVGPLALAGAGLVLVAAALAAARFRARRS